MSSRREKKFVVEYKMPEIIHGSPRTAAKSVCDRIMDKLLVDNGKMEAENTELVEKNNHLENACKDLFKEVKFLKNMCYELTLELKQVKETRVADTVP